MPPTFQEVVVDLISPPGWSLASTASDNTYGFSTLPHMRDFVILGPTDPTGISDTPVRQRVFSCRPATSAAVRPCAEQIVSRLATRAYRRPLAESDLRDLMSFFAAGFAEEGFEGGVRTALEAILASPDFVFRLERVPENVTPGQAFTLEDLAPGISALLLPLVSAARRRADPACAAARAFRSRGPRRASDADAGRPALHRAVHPDSPHSGSAWTTWTKSSRTCGDTRTSTSNSELR